MTTTLITGANKSIGFETARRLTEAGHHVIVAARDEGRGREAADRLGARFVRLDVTDDGSVAAAAADVTEHEGVLDVLVNNAGVGDPRLDVADITADDARRLYEVNVFGPIRVIHAFLPLLAASPAARIVNVSSGMGSFQATHDPERGESQIDLPIYSSSKAALTMLTTVYARMLPGMKVNAADPGLTATDFTGHRGHSVTEGTDAIVELATLGAEGPTGAFRDREGVAAW